MLVSYDRGVADNPEKFRVRNRGYRAKNPEKFRAREIKYYAENREKILERRRKHRANNPDKHNPEKRKEQNREYRKSNPFRIKLLRSKQRSKKKGLAFDLDKEYLEQLWDECGGICSMTGIPMLIVSKEGTSPFVVSVDRIIPEKGYVKGNVRLISNWYNLTRRNFGDEFTHEMCQRVVEHCVPSINYGRRVGSPEGEDPAACPVVRRHYC